MKPICVKCQRFYQIKKTGFYFIEGMPIVQRAQPGTSQPQNWQPYKLWSGDLFECQGCGAQIVVGVGLRPIAEHYQEDFEYEAKALGATFQVNDC
jgi:hypothetical protein